MCYYRCHDSKLNLCLPGSYKTFFIDVMFGVSFSFSEQLWISSMVDFNANELVLLSEGSESSIGFLFPRSPTMA